jgi:hypothetical protein
MIARRIILGSLLLATIAVWWFFYFYGAPQPDDIFIIRAAKKAASADDAGHVSAGQETTAGTVGLGVKSARLELKSTGNTDLLKVIPALPGQGVAFRYEWTKNGEPAGNEDAISGFKRGDKIAVRITPFVGERHGEASTIETEIRNVPPKISENADYEIKDNTLTCQVKASDPDGDKLSYSLEDAPQGMAVDQNGLIRWTFGKDFKGTVHAKVKVTDGQGGEVTRSLTFSIGN